MNFPVLQCLYQAQILLLKSDQHMQRASKNGQLVSTET